MTKEQLAKLVEKYSEEYGISTSEAYDYIVKTLGEENAAVPTPATSEKSDLVLDERIPEISWKDRFVAKQIASPSQALAYLKRKYPNLDLQLSNEEVIGRKPGEKSYRKLDPSSVEMEDITDVAPDVAQGLAQGFLTVAGGLAAPLTGAASGALLETGKQQALKKFADAPEAVDWGQVALQGGMGAVVPAAGTFVTKGIPAYVSKISGVPTDVMSQYVKEAPLIRGLSQNINPYLQGFMSQIKTGTQSLKSQLGQMLEKAIGSAEGKIDIRPVKKIMLDQITELEKKAPPNSPAAQEEIRSLRDTFENLFGKPELKPIYGEKGQVVAQVEMPSSKVMPDLIDPEQAFSLQKIVKDVAEMKGSRPGLGSRLPESASSMEKEFMNSAAEAYSHLNEVFDQITGGMSSEMKAKYAAASELERALKNKFSTMQSTQATLRNLQEPTNQSAYESLRDLGKMAGVEVMEPAKNIRAHKFLGKPENMPLSSGGTTGTARILSGNPLSRAMLGSPEKVKTALDAFRWPLLAAQKAGQGYEALASKMPQNPLWQNVPLKGLETGLWEELVRQKLVNPMTTDNTVGVGQ